MNEQQRELIERAIALLEMDAGGEVQQWAASNEAVKHLRGVFEEGLRQGDLVEDPGIEPDTPTLLMMVGLPYSGKSTIAQALGWPIVCPDEIRLEIHGQRFLPEREPEVWAFARRMVGALFRSGHGVVVLDACNGTLERRNEWRLEGDPWVTGFAVLHTPQEVCVERARAAGDPDMVAVIDRMSAKLQLPDPSDSLS